MENQTDAHVKRAVDEATRQSEAKAERERRAMLQEVIDAHEKEMQAMRDMVGVSAKQRIQDVQDGQDERVRHAVRHGAVQRVAERD